MASLTLSFPIFPPKTLNECRDEVLDCLCTGNKRIEQGERPGPPILDNHLQSFLFGNPSVGTLRIAQSVIRKTLAGEKLLFWREPARVGWVICHEEPKDTPNERGSTAFNDLRVVSCRVSGVYM